MLAISIDGDTFTPAPTLDHLVAQLPQAPVRRVHLSTAELGTPVDHFTWVRASASIADRVDELARSVRSGVAEP